MANKLVYSNPTGEHDVGQVVQAYCPSYKIAAEGTIMAGVWIVGDVACGLGVRLDGDITGNAAKFLPHFFA
jgi:glutathionylspermidine synthase